MASKTVRKASSYAVYPVAGSAYGRRGQLMLDKEPLTHAFDADAQHVLCGKVKASNILDDGALVVEGAAPTCPCCATRLAKLQAAEAAPAVAPSTPAAPSAGDWWASNPQWWG